MDSIKSKRFHPQHLHPRQLTPPLFIAPDLFHYYHPSLLYFLLSHFSHSPHHGIAIYHQSYTGLGHGAIFHHVAQDRGQHVHLHKLSHDDDVGSGVLVLHHVVIQDIACDFFHQVGVTTLAQQLLGLHSILCITPHNR